MEPCHYKEYSTILDSMLNNNFFPILTRFVTEIVRPNLKADARVTDIGAGTGFFCSALLEYFPNLQLTLVEPSRDMMEIAKNRLGDRVSYLEMTIDSAISSLSQQDAFIFQRSLYVIYKDEAHCLSLFEKLHDKLNPSGIIFIQDLSSKYNFEEYQSYLLEECAKTPEQRKELMSQFSVIEKILKTFNQQVDAGKFHLFTKKELEALMATAGFKPLVSSIEDCYAFQRN